MQAIILSKHNECVDGTTVAFKLPVLINSQQVQTLHSRRQSPLAEAQPSQDSVPVDRALAANRRSDLLHNLGCSHHLSVQIHEFAVWAHKVQRNGVIHCK